MTKRTKMDEDQDATLNIQTVDDEVEEWGEAVPVKNSRRLSAAISVRFSPEELDLLKSAVPAGAVSAFVRTAAIEKAHSEIHSQWRLKFFTNSPGSPVNVVTFTSVVATSSGSPWSESDWRTPTIGVS
jgi:hypothetical protein